MNHSLLESLPRPLREAVESAGYRVRRWAAAREVLGRRAAKDRISGALGASLHDWLPAAPMPVGTDDLALVFSVLADRVQLTGGSAALVASPLEHALLHLPALRSFWRNELRQQHFAALQAMVPQAWLMADTPVPHGAVIHGLGITAWDQLQGVHGHEWDMRDRILTRHAPAGEKINACYERDEQGRVVLRSVEAMP